MSSINWKMITALGLIGGAGVVWIPKALEPGAPESTTSAPMELPVMIDPATGLPIELGSDGEVVEGPEAAPSGNPVSPGIAAQPPVSGGVASALTVGVLDSAALLELASSLRSERIARSGESASMQDEPGSLPLPAQRIAPKVEEVLSLYPLSATLSAAGKQLAIIAGEAVELDQSFGPDGLVLREIGWDSVTVEYQGQRYPLRLPSFRSVPAAAPQADLVGMTPPEPNVP